MQLSLATFNSRRSRSSAATPNGVQIIDMASMKKAHK
jgi:hypothetical protein